MGVGVGVGVGLGSGVVSGCLCWCLDFGFSRQRRAPAIFVNYAFSYCLTVIINYVTSCHLFKCFLEFCI